MTDIEYDRAWTGHNDFVASEGTLWPFRKKGAKALNRLAAMIGGIRAVTGALVLAGAFALATEPAQAAIDTCALDGPYNTSLGVGASPLVQFLGTFDFHKPGVCTNAGSVDISGALVSGDTSTPVSATGLAYTVDAAGLFQILVDTA